MKTTTLKLEEALGKPLAHDLTQIVADEHYKGARFRKGQIITEKDVDILRSMGREHLALLELDDDEVHENDAALRFAARLQGLHLETRGPSEGKCVLVAEEDGILCIDEASVDAVNEDVDLVLATLSNKTPVRRGEQVAAFRIRPLAMKEDRVKRAEEACRPLSILPYRPMKAGLVTTGREVYEGRIQDASRPRMERKIASFGGILAGQELAPDDQGIIASAILKFLGEGADLVICTGGMSVDVDDLTPAAIRQVCDEVLFQGVPALPGSMLMLGRRGEAFVIGAPACVIHDERTTLDPLLEQLFAGLIPGKREVRRWGLGGLCRRCTVCTYPNCLFATRR